MQPMKGDTIVVSDTHISLRSDPVLVRRFCDFLESVARDNARYRAVVIAGDLFNLDIDAEARGDCGTRRILERILARFPELEAGLAHLLRAGINIVVLAGNHDIELFYPDVAGLFRDVILIRAAEGSGPASGSLNLTSPKFWRIAQNIHVEHGNQFDKDNMFDEAAFESVLRGKKPVFPLGSCLERRFLSRFPQLNYTGFAANTPWPLFKTVLSRHGLAAGLNITFSYHLTTFGLLAESMRRRRVARGMRHNRVPTLSSPIRTLHRLYLDRSIAFIAAVLWMLLTPVGLYVAARAWLAASAGLTLLFLAALAGGNRYRNATSVACCSGARELMQDPDITTVILGHTHESLDAVLDAEGHRYLNAGSVMSPTPEGCPYVLVSESPDGCWAELRYFA